MKTAVRRVLLMSALMSPGALYALGLGEIRLNSALNQPFDAEIELVSAAQEDLAALRASLASSDTFQRYGLDKPAYLADFTFRVVSSGGRDVLKVTSPRPVTEPFVTLLVEANWPRGRLLREYTVLLDPPVFAPAPAETVAPVATPRVTGTPPAPRPAPVQAAAPEAAPAPSAPRVSRPTAAVGAEPGANYRVRPNDTLWGIASAAYPGSRAEVNSAMLAIYQANPAAFGGNINVLRAGSNLRMPSSGDVAAISASAAAEEVARQYRLWQQGTPEAAGPAADVGRLRLVTPEQGSAAPSTATAQGAAPASSDALQNRVQQLEKELAEARRLLEVRNAELATLQGTTTPAQPATPTEGAAPGEPAAPAAGAEGAPATAEAPAATAAPEPQPEAAPAPASPESKAKAAEPEPSLLDRLREFWWAPLGLLLALLGLLAFLRNRRSSGSVEEDLEAALSRKADDLRHRPSPAQAARDSSIVVEERRPVEPVAARVAPAAVAQAPEPSRKPVSIEDTLSGEGPVSIEAGDPLAEADFHMAYGLYDQAADLVQVASKREPQRRDLKLKLLEIFFVWGNRDRFLEVAREMNATRREAQPGEWDKILIMGRQLAPDDPLFAGAPTPAAGAGLDMELHDTVSAMDFELPALGEEARPDLDLSVRDAAASAAGGGLDFMLDEPVRGSDEDAALAPTVETPRLKSAAADEPTTEVPIEDLGIDVGDLAGLDGSVETEIDLTKRTKAVVEDTVERPNLAQAAAEDDLLSSTSIMSGETITQIAGEAQSGVVDLSDATGELPALEGAKLDMTGMHRAPDFGIDGEAATMSEVGTKLDLARAYIDMGDPEGARSILDEVLREGSPVQRKEAERLLAGLP